MVPGVPDWLDWSQEPQIGPDWFKEFRLAQTGPRNIYIYIYRYIYIYIYIYM